MSRLDKYPIALTPSTPPREADWQVCIPTGIPEAEATHGGNMTEALKGMFRNLLAAQRLWNINVARLVRTVFAALMCGIEMETFKQGRYVCQSDTN